MICIDEQSHCLLATQRTRNLYIHTQLQAEMEAGESIFLSGMEIIS